MVPHPLIHLKLAQIRHDQLTMGKRRSRFDLNAIRDERRRSERRAELGRRWSYPLLAARLVRHARESRSTLEAHFAHREGHGITVDLYWTHGEHRDAFRVEVIDHRSETTFTLHPATGKEAVDAYHHPFAMRSRGRSLDLAA